MSDSKQQDAGCCDMQLTREQAAERDRRRRSEGHACPLVP